MWIIDRIFGEDEKQEEEDVSESSEEPDYEYNEEIVEVYTYEIRFKDEDGNLWREYSHTFDEPLKIEENNIFVYEKPELNIYNGIYSSNVKYESDNKRVANYSVLCKEPDIDKIKTTEVKIRSVHEKTIVYENAFRPNEWRLKYADKKVVSEEYENMGYKIQENLKKSLSL